MNARSQLVRAERRAPRRRAARHARRAARRRRGLRRSSCRCARAAAPGFDLRRAAGPALAQSVPLERRAGRSALARYAGFSWFRTRRRGPPRARELRRQPVRSCEALVLELARARRRAALPARLSRQRRDARARRGAGVARSCSPAWSRSTARAPRSPAGASASRLRGAAVAELRADYTDPRGAADAVASSSTSAAEVERWAQPRAKKLIKTYFKLIATGSPKLPDLLADDVTWWVPPGSDMAGTLRGQGQGARAHGQRRRTLRPERRRW